MHWALGHSTTRSCRRGDGCCSAQVEGAARVAAAANGQSASACVLPDRDESRSAAVVADDAGCKTLVLHRTNAAPRGSCPGITPVGSNNRNTNSGSSQSIQDSVRRRLMQPNANEFLNQTHEFAASESLVLLSDSNPPGAARYGSNRH